MVGMQNEQQIQRFHGHRICRVGLARNRKKHVEHIGAIRQVVAWIDKRLTQRVFVGRSCDGRQFGNDAMGKNLPVVRIVDIRGVVVESGHRGDHRRDHRHGMCVVMEAPKKSKQAFVDHRVPGY